MRRAAIIMLPTLPIRRLPLALAILLVHASLVRADGVGVGYSISGPTYHLGALDGSAGVAIDDGHFLSVSDEENVFRLYPVDPGPGREIVAKPTDLNAWSMTAKNPKHPQRFQEFDLEGATRSGNRAYFIGSHGRDKRGVVQRERRFFFAADISGVGKSTALTLVGAAPYGKLIADFLDDPKLDDLLRDAVGDAKPDPAKAPKQPGALNIESLCADGDALLIGFRNPVPSRHALLVRMLNPRGVVEQGEAARFDPPIMLDLGGLGIRDMTPWRDGFAIIAGDIGGSDARPSQLFLWNKQTDTLTSLNVNFIGLNPEALIVMGKDADARLLILSDDGKRQPEARPDGKPSFRSVWLVPPATGR